MVVVFYVVFIDRLHYCSFIYFIVVYVFNAAQIGYLFRSSLSYEFEQFGLLYMCAPMKDIGRSGI